MNFHIKYIGGESPQRVKEHGANTMIRCYKENSNTWTVWNTWNNKTADIVKIDEHNAIMKIKQKYRVDVKGNTYRSLIHNFNTAKGIAYNQVK